MTRVFIFIIYPSFFFFLDTLSFTVCDPIFRIFTLLIFQFLSPLSEIEDFVQIKQAF